VAEALEETAQLTEVLVVALLELEQYQTVLVAVYLEKVLLVVLDQKTTLAVAVEPAR
jgi:hypothetical protein